MACLFFVFCVLGGGGGCTFFRGRALILVGIDSLQWPAFFVFFCFFCFFLFFSVCFFFFFFGGGGGCDGYNLASKPSFSVPLGLQWLLGALACTL